MPEYEHLYQFKTQNGYGFLLNLVETPQMHGCVNVMANATFISQARTLKKYCGRIKPFSQCQMLDKVAEPGRSFQLSNETKLYRCIRVSQSGLGRCPSHRRVASSFVLLEIR